MMVRRICENCSEDYAPTAYEAAWLQEELGIQPAEHRYRKGVVASSAAAPVTTAAWVFSNCLT